MQAFKSCASINKISTIKFAINSIISIELKINYRLLLKEKEQILKVQLQVDYNAIASIQNMLAQLAINHTLLSSI
jgi:hypothetical protein